MVAYSHNTANVEEMQYDEKTGQYMDSAGNPIYVQPQTQNRFTPLFYTQGGRGQTVHYADVFPGPANVHENAALTNLAIRFEVDEGIVIGQKIAPALKVPHRSDVFYKVDTEQEAIRNPADGEDKREVGVPAREIKQGFDKDSFAVQNYALRDFLPDDTVNNADEALEMVNSATRFLTSTLLYRSDARLLQTTLASGNFTNGTMTALGGGKVAAATEALRYIQLALRAGRKAAHDQNMMKQPNVVVLSADLASRIAASPELISTAKHQIGAQYIVDGGWRGENWGLPNTLYGLEVVVANHVENTAAKGQTKSISDVLTDNMILLNVETPSRKTRNTITTFRNGEGVRVRTYRDDHRKGVWVEAELVEDRHITNSLGGYVITDCV